MRRLAFAAAVCGTLVLAACSEQQQSPTEPPAPAPPDATLSTCRPVRFPIVKVSALVTQVFPAGKLRVEALARAIAVAALWDTCHPDGARRVAVDFVNWIDLKAPSSAPAAKVLELKLAILNGVGIPVAAPPPGATDDFGAGTFDPAKTTKTLIKTKSGKALVQLDPGSFDELTFITLSRKADDFKLHDFDGRQFPPVYDYDATNASGNHVLQNGKKAIVAFCLIGLDDALFPDGYPDHPRIGHNPVAGAGQPAFEILEEVNLAEEGLDDDLSPTLCGYTPEEIGSFGSGPKGLAKAAWWAADRYLSPLLLPEPLSAATVMGTLPPPPPIGGRAPSLSPFEVVEVTSNRVENTGRDLGAEGAGPYYVGQPLDTCNDGCGPRFRLTDGEVTIQTPTPVTVTLLPDDGSHGDLSGTVTRTTSAENSYVVEFDDLRISLPGTYRLVVSAPGTTSYTTGSFTVLPARGTIHGTVMSVVTGPLAGVLVTVNPGGRTVTTNVTGAYEISGIAPGETSLIVSNLPTSCFGLEGRDISVTPGQIRQEDFEVICHRVAYQLFESPDFEIAVMNADGSGQARLTNNDLQEFSPAWSPDGTKLAFSSDGEIYVMNANGTGVTALTDDAFFDSHPSWSPDGGKIAYRSVRALNTGAIFIINADGSDEPSRITSDGHYGAPEWSPDGAKIAFGLGSDLYIMNANGTNQTEIWNNELANGDPAWSPDGTKIAFSAGVPGGEEGNNDYTYEIYVINADGSGPAAQITRNSQLDIRPAWSPDGSKIIYVSELDGWSVWIVNADGSGEPSQFTPVGHSVEDVTW
jgi:hypothetical protein